MWPLGNGGRQALAVRRVAPPIAGCRLVGYSHLRGGLNESGNEDLAIGGATGTQATIRT